VGKPVAFLGKPGGARKGDAGVRREDKLLLFAALAYFLVAAGAAAFGPVESRWAGLSHALPFGLFPALHVGIRRMPPRGALLALSLPLVASAYRTFSAFSLTLEGG